MNRRPDWRNAHRMTADNDPTLRSMSHLMQDLRSTGGPPPPEQEDPLSGHEELVEQLRQIPQAEPSAGFTARVMERIAHPRATQFHRWSRIALQTAAALALLLAASTLFVRVNQNEAAGLVKEITRKSRIEAGTGPLLQDSPLAYLARTQRADGSWSDTGGQTADFRPRYSTGISALALLAFIKQEPAPLQGGHAPVIRRGVEHLIAIQRVEEDERFTGSGFNQYLAAKALEAAAALPGAPAHWTDAAWLALHRIPEDALSRERINQMNRHLARADWDQRHWEKVGGPVMVAAIAAIHIPYAAH